jgi:phage portal protein BeeE
MSTNTAMRHPTVFACVRIIADVIASLPVDAVHR